MLVLAIDSSATASLALGEVDEAAAAVKILARRTSKDTRSHAEVLAPYLHGALAEAGVQWPQISALVVGTGPGPFTGLRAGIMTARTVGFARGLPVYGLMSLFALAHDAAEVARARGYSKFLVATDARRREIYSAQFALTETGYELVTGPTVGPASEAGNLPAFGRGSGMYSQDLLAVEGFENLLPRADSLLAAAARLGLGNLSLDTSALYLRESDAKVPTTRKKVGHGTC